MIRIRSFVWLLGACTAVILGPMTAAAAPLAPEAIPGPLRTWVPWALHGNAMIACPRSYQAPNERACVWPGSLEIETVPGGARFRLAVTAYGSGARVALPGDAEAWPLGVTSGRDSLAVTTDQSGGPIVAVPAGDHVITGRFEWSRAPQTLRVPVDAGIVQLKGAATQPVPDSQGRLWLGAGPVEQATQDSVTIRRFRLIDDGIPLTVTTRFDLEIAGKPRSITLASALLPDFAPLALESPLPAKLDASGVLSVQSRPGRWSIAVTGRRMTPTSALGLPAITGDASSGASPEPEIWSFIAREALRVVTVSGAPSVDAKQVPMPDAWRRYPAFAVVPGTTLQFAELRRGAVGRPADPLSITRKLWLDFDGGGLTAQDTVQGALGAPVRLEASGGLRPGRVAVNGVDQVVTRSPGEAGSTGVELPPGSLVITADSRIEHGDWTLPATGWKRDFRGARVDLNVPPGWRVLHVTGADAVSGSWAERWTLYDFFFVLLAGLAAGRLFGRGIGVATLVGLALAWHTEAPRLLWIVLLALVAIIRLVPQGRAARVFSGLRWGVAAVIAVLLIPFAIDEIRTALYPALERRYAQIRVEPAQVVTGGGAEENARRDSAATLQQQMRPQSGEDRAANADAVDKMSRLDEGAEPGRERGKLNADPPAPPVATPAPVPPVQPPRGYGRGGASVSSVSGSVALRPPVVDPTQKVQTGPGIPGWQWNRAQLSWQGPVSATQSIGLWLLAPWQNALVSVLRVALLAVLLWIFVDRPRPRLDRFAPSSIAASVALVLAVALAGGEAQAQEGGIPPESTLDALRDKLTAAPDCMPRCAELARLAIDAAGARIALRLEVHAAAEVSVPLPGQAAQWRPRQVLLDGRNAPTRRTSDGTLWLVVPAGVHQIVIDANATATPNVQLTLPMPPRAVSSTLAGWTLEGLDDRGLATGALQLTRSSAAGRVRADATTDRDSLPPFVRIVRTIRLGQTWTIDTTIERFGPSRSPAIVRIPLVAGESVTAADVRTDGGVAIVNLGAGIGAAFTSSIRIATTLKFTASSEPNQVEQWQFDIGPQWHIEPSGVAPVDPSAGAQLWRPWPGETLEVAISKPQAIDGATVTVDAATLEVRPGASGTTVTATMALRSSQGGPHVVKLPEGAELQGVQTNGAPQPVRADGREVRIALAPGPQTVQISWRDAAGISTRFVTPTLDVGANGVNASIRAVVPSDRWVLAVGGPRIGPAVLFWGMLIVVAVVAGALARTRATPIGFTAWLLLGVGLTQTSVIGAAFVVAWFFLMSARRRAAMRLGPRLFDLLQIALVLWTLAALVVLFGVLQSGLLGSPDMQIAGNGSHSGALSWFQDRWGPTLPSAWILSVPVLVYRLLMLAWALWLAQALLGWARWAWREYVEGGAWRTWRRAKFPDAPNPAPAG